MIDRLTLAAAALALLGATGCSSAPPADHAWCPNPPARYLDTPPPSFCESDLDLDPLADALTRVRVLEIGNQWPPADAWQGGVVDQGDGILRVRTPDCRRERWTSSPSTCSSSRDWQRGRRRGRSRHW
jgi:hypothetical protein